MRLVGNDASCPVAHQTWKRARKKERKKERNTTLESRELSGFFPLNLKIDDRPINVKILEILSSTTRVLFI